MKIRYDNKEVTKRVGEIPCGTVFNAETLSGVNNIFLKEPDRAVNLQDPSWYLGNYILVFGYKELDAELLVKEEK